MEQIEFAGQATDDTEEEDELQRSGNCWQKILLVVEEKLVLVDDVRLVVEELKLVEVLEVRLEVEEKLALVVVEKLDVRLDVEEKLVPEENELLLTGVQRQH